MQWYWKWTAKGLVAVAVVEGVEAGHVEFTPPVQPGVAVYGVEKALPKSPHGHSDDNTPIRSNVLQFNLAASTASTPSGSTLATRLF